MASTEVNKLQLYNDINKYGLNGDFARALKASNKVLNILPNDESAFHCKIVCLLNMGRFDDALQAFNKYPHLSKNLVFEKAHCQYRLNMNQDALTTLNSGPQEVLKIKELKAQLFYRLERYEECYNLYNDILKNSSDEFEEERLTNLAAIIAALALSGKEVDMPTFDFESYELVFNIACSLIFKGKYIEAEKKLRHAEKLYKEFCEDGSNDEVEEDLTIIRVQLGYCIHLQGREKEAKAIYNSILQSKPTDPAVLAVLSNNWVAINKDQSLFDTKKKIKNCLTDNAQLKLTSWQNKQIAINNCFLSLRTGQHEHALELCRQLVKNYPDAEWIESLVNASLLLKDSKKKEAIDMLTDYSKKYPEYKILLFLTIAQLLTIEGDFDKVCDIFEDLSKLQYRPGIVSTLASLYLELGKSGKAAEFLQRAVTWHQANQSKSVNLNLLWRNSADLNLCNGQPEVAVQSLEEVLKSDPDNVVTLAQLVVSLTKFDVNKAKYYCEKLTGLIDCSTGIDISALEASNWLTAMKALKKSTKVENSPRIAKSDSKLKMKAPSKKKKKNKLPKNCTPSANFVPDPERWLPKYERSTYKKKRDRRGKDVGKGTQGTAASVSDQFDITKRAAQKSNIPSPSNTDSSRTPRKPAAHKKKKKGGKW